jgi:AcrR family transcriptional regulator
MLTLTKSRHHPAQHRSRRTVARILDAARSLLARIPFDQVSTKRIAAEAGLSVGGLYRFFPDRDRIIDAITGDHIHTFSGRVEREFVRPAFEQFPNRRDFDPCAVLPGMIDAYVAYVDQHPDFRNVSFARDYRELGLPRGTHARSGLRKILFDLGLLHLGVDFTPEIQRKLRVASEAGERLMGYAYEQPTREQRDQVIAEVKKMLARYLNSAMWKRS